MPYGIGIHTENALQLPKKLLTLGKLGAQARAF